MRFRLTYEGELKASQPGKKISPHKHSIRRCFHPQLKHLWDNHKLLSEFKMFGTLEEKHEMMEQPFMGYGRWAPGDDEVRPLKNVIAEHFSIKEYNFVPLVCQSFQLQCSLDILLLDEDRSRLTKGDIDNRLKTLIDSLRMPSTQELRSNRKPCEGEDPFFCLLEDDRLINSFSVERDILWSEGTSDNFAKVIIGVTIQPTFATSFNLGFA